MSAVRDFHGGLKPPLQIVRKRIAELGQFRLVSAEESGYKRRKTVPDSAPFHGSIAAGVSRNATQW